VAALISLLQPGAQKPNDNPYSIVIVANPGIESPINSGNFVADPILNSQAAFDGCARYVVASVFGRLPGQAETFMSQFTHEIRVISIFDPGVTPTDDTSLTGEWNPDDVIGPRQEKFAPFLARYQINGRPIRADVAFAATASATHTRSSAYYTADDDASAGVSFPLDGVQKVHRFNNIHPGAVALHVDDRSIVALHEFGHAASSWTNGSVTDLYVDSPPALNVKHGRPIPSQFGTLDLRTFAADPVRDHISYDAGWMSYHCALVAPAFPAVMDDFWLASTNRPEDCKHDQITLQFLTDRVRAIISRP
jgi:hypothetical protein